MKTFLECVTNYLLDNYTNDLRDILLIFPNQRPKAYLFEKIKERLNGKTCWLPQTATIDHFLTKHSGVAVASQETLLALLFKVYQDVSANNNETFDHFYPWAETLLKDFDDIDKYMVDAQSILKCIEDIKELDDKFDYITEEQKNAIIKFFTSYNNSQQDSELKKRFLSIWHIILSLYNQLNAELDKQHIAYQGKAYRMAVEKIGDSELPFKKVCFIGFNAITQAEYRIFQILKNRKQAVFFWDADKNFINIDDNTPGANKEAGLFLRRYMQEFPNPNGFECPSVPMSNKQIRIIASPSQMGQLDAVASLLATNQNDIQDSAVVLSDESLLETLVDRISATTSNINITMGAPVKNSLSGQWIEAIIRLQSNIQASKDGSSTFYYKNVNEVLRHPFYTIANNNFVKSTLDAISSEHYFQVPMNNLIDDNDTFSKTVFTPITNADSLFQYIRNVLHLLIELFTNNDEPQNENLKVHTEMLVKIWKQIGQQYAEIKKNNITMEVATCIKLLRRTISSITVPYEGKQTEGLQVMGFLETRALDFKNIYITNVNEGILPLDGKGPSFLPYNLRKGFGLPTNIEREAMYAYYFYRLIQRAQNVTLIYCNSSSDQALERSRYILQLIYSNAKIEQLTMPSTIRLSAPSNLCIEKTDEVMACMTKYLVDGNNDNAKALSPSSLITYQKCPLLFYLQSVLSLREGDEFEEEIDARVLGNIFHKAAETLYNEISNERKTTITEEILDRTASNNELIDKHLQNAFICVLQNNKHNNDFKIEGRNALIFEILHDYIVATLKYDKQHAPIKIVALEENYYATIDVQFNNQQHKVKVGGTIDRVDIDKNGTHRIVDYKTGSNDIQFESINNFFDPTKIDKAKGALQTLIYGLSYQQQTKTDANINAYLYMIKLAKTNKPDFLVHTKSKSTDEFSEGNFVRISNLVQENTTNIIAEIFNRNNPFTQTENEKNCTHCCFKLFCSK